MKQYLKIVAALFIIMACNKHSNHENKNLELVFADDTDQLTGIAREQNNGRLIVNYPRWSDIYLYGVIQAQGLTGKIPYPDAAMNQWQQDESGLDKWVCVQSVYFDDNGILWILDPAAPMMKTIQAGGAKLVKMNKVTNMPERTYSFTGLVPDTAYVNDVRIDVQRQYAYLTESKGGGLIVVNLNSGQMRRVLTSHYSVKSDPSYRYIIDGHELMKDGRPVKINSDGIALTPDNEWIYYKPTTDDKLYRIKTEYLRDWSMDDAALGAKVEDLGILHLLMG